MSKLDLILYFILSVTALLAIFICAQCVSNIENNRVKCYEINKERPGPEVSLICDGRHTIR
jgi:hypothetical protein